LDFATVEEKPIRLVAGLGNPGPEYAPRVTTSALWSLDQFAAQFGSTWERSTSGTRCRPNAAVVMIVKPKSFMNRSGYPLLAIAQFYKIEPREILVVLDDLALPLGRLRLRIRGGTGGHNGLESIVMQFGTEEIPRLRIGIGEAPPEGSSITY